MAAPMKRPASDDQIESFTEKISSNVTDSIRLTKFLNWANASGIILNEKVAVRREGSCAQNGMVAIEDIKEKELLFQIPRKYLLTPTTCGIAHLLKAADNDGSLKGTSGWAPLLVSLLYEYNNPDSKWRPYLDLVPDFKELDLPMFWSSSERTELLAGTGVMEAVNTDLGNMEKEFTETILPFINKHPDIFSAACKNIDFYKQMVSFVMAYSFTEELEEEEDLDNNGEESNTKKAPPMMVPMADILNHVSRNNASLKFDPEALRMVAIKDISKVNLKEDLDNNGEESNTKKTPPMMVPMADILNHVSRNYASLKFDPEALRMVAIKDIAKGEEVFNTYGQLGNEDLLHMYGFSEAFQDNLFDTVEISPETVIDVAKDIEVNKKELLGSKVQFLQDLCLLGGGVNLIIGDGEIMNDDDVITVLKVLLMNETDFNTYVDNEGWEEDLENEAEESLSFDNISKIPDQWKDILCNCAEARLKQYPTSMKDDEKQLKTSTVTTRQRYSLNTAYGQKRLLHSLIDHCKTKTGPTGDGQS